MILQLQFIMDSTRNLVSAAVKQPNASKKQSVLQKLFAVWFDAFVYNQIWEDPRVDVQALNLNAESRILTISSGGCNALNYLLENPASVTAVDLNRHHIYLLRLKINALRYLPDHEDFFNFFGHGKHAANTEKYRRHIAPHLDDGTRNFWEKSSLFGRVLNNRRIDYFRRNGLYEHSRNGYFLRFFHRMARLFGSRPEEILKARTIEEQEILYRKFIAPFFDSILIKTIGKMPVTMFGLGIPPQQHAELMKDLLDGGNLVDVLRERTHRLAADFPIQENYFAWQAFARRYDTENRRAIPDYLKAENYEALKCAAHKITTKIGSITEEIKTQPKNAFNRFVFLDAQDWMNAEMLTELWTAIAEKSEAGSRIIFRTAAAASPLETTLLLLPPPLREKFTYEETLSRELFKQDRAAIYGGFHLYVLRD